MRRSLWLSCRFNLSTYDLASGKRFRTWLKYLGLVPLSSPSSTSSPHNCNHRSSRIGLHEIRNGKSPS